jgi:hypothetical protein
MKGSRSLRLLSCGAGAAVCLGLLVGAGLALSMAAARAQISRIDRVNALFATQSLPNYSTAQRDAIVGLQTSILHPKLQDQYASERIARFAKVMMRVMAGSSATPLPTLANFVGNRTAITVPGPGGFVMRRETNCSLTLQLGTYAFSSSASAPLTIQPAGTTPNYEQMLHVASGLTTTPDSFPNGCSDSRPGIGSRRGVFLGKTSSNHLLYAGAGYYSSSGGNALWYGSMDPSSMAPDVLSTDTSEPGINALVSGDLDGNGMADIVGTDSTAAKFSVWLVHSDGTLAAPVSYTLPGSNAEGAVIADVNGDGKLDVVVATVDSSFNEQISVLTGKGDGTLNPPQSFAVSKPTGTSVRIETLIAVDLRGTGRPDLVASNGLVLLNSGSGTFTPAAAAAFLATPASSDYGPNLTTADFNKDGKPDLAVDVGQRITIYTGNGDGTFTLGNAYASIDNVGYISATDLDGDGNVDLYAGLADGGSFGGDQFGPEQAYALMGNGDGTFRGAPSLPFVYTGTNLADLNGDKILDAVGVNTDLSLTSYLGDGSGHFAAGSTLTTSPVMVSGSQQTLSNIDSLSIGDVDGDGVPDAVYIGIDQSTTPVLFFAKGDGHGGFTAPTALPTPSFVAPATDINEMLSQVRLADVNHDGKLDLVYGYSDTNSQTNTVIAGTSIQLGNGDGTFGAPRTLAYYSGTAAFFPTSRVALIADLNKDGNPDLLLLTQTSTIDSTLSTYVTKMQVALGKGDGTFNTPADVAGPDLMIQMLSGTQYASVTLADMNGDGIQDIVALGSSTTYNVQVCVALGNGDGTFKAPILKTYSGQFLNGQGLAVADFDGDGKQDVAITNPYSLYVSGVALGNGDGTLQSTGDANGTYLNYNFALSVGGATLVADLNGDGKPDIIAANVELLSQVATTGGGSTGTGTGTADFAIATNPSSGSAAAGTPVTTTLALTPSNGFNQSVTLSCSGLPADASCSFAPATLTVGSGTATSVLTIATAARTALNPRGISSSPLAPAGGILLACLAPCFLRRKATVSAALCTTVCLVLMLVGAGTLTGCGGHGSGGGAASPSGTGTAAGTYPITITATAGSTVHTVVFSLTVS